MMNRKNTRAVNVGGVIVGGNYPIVIQSMTNTPTEDVAQTVNQILELEREGCQIVKRIGAGSCSPLPFEEKGVVPEQRQLVR